MAGGIEGASVRLKAAALLGAGVALLGLGEATGNTLPTEFADLAQACAPNIHPVTLAAVVRQESGGNPYAIGVNRGAARLKRQPANASEAIATATWLKDQGHDFDGGLAQINVRNLGWLGLSIADLFDPCKNLQAAQAVLTDCYSRASRSRESQAALHAALSCYNTGTFTRGFSNGYVAKVAGRVGSPVAALPAIEGPAVLAAETAEVAAPSPQADEHNAGGDVFGRGVSDAFSGSRRGEEKTSPLELRSLVTVRQVNAGE